MPGALTPHAHSATLDVTVLVERWWGQRLQHPRDPDRWTVPFPTTFRLTAFVGRSTEHGSIRYWAAAGRSEHTRRLLRVAGARNPVEALTALYQTIIGGPTPARSGRTAPRRAAMPGGIGCADAAEP